MVRDLFMTRRERIRRKAATWIARLNGPEGGRHQAEFEDWYRSDPEHAETYDRLLAQFQAAGSLGRTAAPARPGSMRRPRSFRWGYAVAALAAAAVLLVFLVSARSAPISTGGSRQVASFESGPQERRIVLADGSEVLLAADSAVAVALGAQDRRVRLIRGEGRFFVAHEARPFSVAADGTEIVARGTQFVVRLASGRTIVALLEGKVDVSYAPSPAQPERRRVAQLRPGEQLVVTRRSDARSSTATARAPASAPVQQAETRHVPMLEFDDQPLIDAVAQVNRFGRPRVRLADPALHGLRVTGAFRGGDPAGFAEAVAAAFGLAVERAPDGTLSLHSAAPRE